MTARKPNKANDGKRASPSNSNPSAIFSARDMPPAFERITDEARISPGGSIRWGWRQWITLLPKLERHVKARGREGLGAMLNSAQRTLLPAELWRGRDSLYQSTSPNSTLDLLALTAFLAAMRSKVDYAKALAVQPSEEEGTTAVQPEAPPAAAAAIVEAAAPAAHEPPAPVPAPAPVPDRPLRDDLRTLLDTPITLGALLLPLRAFALDALRDALRPTVIRDLVREAVADVVGQPVPAAPSTAAAAAADTPPQEPQPAQQQDAPAAAAAADPAPDAAPADEQPAQALNDEAPAQQAHSDDEAAPHDIESQMRAALGLPLPTPYQAHRHEEEQRALRESVIVVGLAPQAQRDLERIAGKSFRFTFKKPFHFNEVTDLPVTTDAVLLYKKRLNKTLLQLTRRYSIPIRDVTNEAASMIAALRELFPHALPAQPLPLGKRVRAADTNGGAHASHH